MTLDDLTEALRGCNVASFDEVEYALIETNGKASVITKSECSPATCQQLKLQPDENTLPILLICDGKINNENIKLANLSFDDINKILNKNNIKKVKDVLVMTIDNSGKVYLQAKKQKRQVFSIKFSGGNNW